jgi:hypothetical protein
MARVERKLVADLHMRRKKRRAQVVRHRSPDSVVPAGNTLRKSEIGNPQGSPKSPKPAISDERAFCVSRVSVKFALFVLFALPTIAGAAALLTASMQALTGDDVGLVVSSRRSVIG